MTETIPNRFYPDQSMKFVPIDLTTLGGVLDGKIVRVFGSDFELYFWANFYVKRTYLKTRGEANTDACVILTKRVNINGAVKPYNKHFCSSYDAAFTGYEPWSTTKFSGLSDSKDYFLFIFWYF